VAQHDPGPLPTSATATHCLDPLARLLLRLADRQAARERGQDDRHDDDQAEAPRRAA
jgi:hypothetical protein